MLVAFATYLGSAYWFRATPEQIEQMREEGRKEKVEFSDRKARADAEAKRAEEMAPKIEEALEDLEKHGITRKDLKNYFYEEIENQVCDERNC